MKFLDRLGGLSWLEYALGLSQCFRVGRRENPTLFEADMASDWENPAAMIQPGNEEFPTEDPLEPSGHGTEAV
jgi:hypothetical protein